MTAEGFKRCVRRLDRKGFSRSDIRRVLGCEYADIAEVLGKTTAMTDTERRAKVIAELLAEGHPVEVVRANFGEVLV